MATDDERRRVAERLRSFVTDDSVYADVDACRVLHSIGLYYKDIDRIYFSGFDVAHLADLIEPSCDAAATHTDATATRDVSQCRRSDVDRDALMALAGDLETYRLPISGIAVAEHIREACGEVVA